MALFGRLQSTAQSAKGKAQRTKEKAERTKRKAKQDVRRVEQKADSLVIEGKRRHERASEDVSASLMSADRAAGSYMERTGDLGSGITSSLDEPENPMGSGVGFGYSGDQRDEMNMGMDGSPSVNGLDLGLDKSDEEEDGPTLPGF